MQAQKQYPLSVNIIKKRPEDTADTAKVLISAKWWKAVKGDHFTDKAKLDLCLKAYEKKLELTAATKGPDLAVRLDETLKALDLVIRAAAMNIKSANTVTQKRTMTQLKDLALLAKKKKIDLEAKLRYVSPDTAVGDDRKVQKHKVTPEISAVWVKKNLHESVKPQGKLIEALTQFEKLNNKAAPKKDPKRFEYFSYLNYQLETAIEAAGLTVKICASADTEHSKVLLQELIKKMELERKSVAKELPANPDFPAGLVPPGAEEESGSGGKAELSADWWKKNKPRTGDVGKDKFKLHAALLAWEAAWEEARRAEGNDRSDRLIKLNTAAKKIDDVHQAASYSLKACNSATQKTSMANLKALIRLVENKRSGLEKLFKEVDPDAHIIPRPVVDSFALTAAWRKKNKGRFVRDTGNLEKALQDYEDSLDWMSVGMSQEEGAAARKTSLTHLKQIHTAATKTFDSSSTMFQEDTRDLLTKHLMTAVRDKAAKIRSFVLPDGGTIETEEYENRDAAFRSNLVGAKEVPEAEQERRKQALSKYSKASGFKVLKDKELGPLFKQCAKEQFFVESVFLYEILEKDPHPTTRTAGIYNKFLRRGADLEVNLSHGLRNQITQCFEETQQIDDEMWDEIMKSAKTLVGSAYHDTFRGWYVNRAA